MIWSVSDSRLRWPCIMPKNLARLVLSQSCSLFVRVVSRRLAIIWLIVSLSASTSPRASTAMVRVRSPLMTAVATSEIARTCVVRLAASWFTLSVRSRQVPAAPGHLGLPAELALDADLARDRGHLLGERAQRVGHVVDGVGERRDLALGDEHELLGEVAVGDRGDDLADAAHLVGEVRGHEVDVVGEVLPRAGDAGHPRLAAELALGADLARDARDLGGEGAQLLDHRVDGVLELEDLALGLDGDLLREVAVGDGGRDERDVAHLRGEVAGEHVHAVGEVLPRAGGARHARLAAELALDADLARHGRHLIGEGAQRVGHVVDGVGERRDLAPRLEDQLLREVAVGDRGHDLGDAAHLAGQVGGHHVDVVGEVLPRAGDAGDLRLAAELALGADLARDAGDLAGEGAELLDHRVDGVLELEDLALRVDGDLLREVAVGDRRGDSAMLRTWLVRLPGEHVDVVGEVAPGAGGAGHLGLPAELALGADLARDRGHLLGEGAQRVGHVVDGVGERGDLALRLDARTSATDRRWRPRSRP